MSSFREKTIVYWLAAALLAVAVVCYAAFPRQPEDPVRIMLINSAGNVLFDHQGHAAPDKYGYLCLDCHHAMDEGERPTSCGECHEPEGQDPIKRSEAFHQQCIGCHQEDGTAPVECAGCHVL